MTTTLATAVQALRDVPRGEVYARSSDRDLMAANASIAEARRLLDAHSSLVVGELTRRESLVRATGARSVEEFLKKNAGLTGREAAITVRVGRLTQAALDGEGGPLAPVTAGLNDGRVSLAAAEAIRAGLDGTSDVDAGLVTAAAARLCATAETTDPDALFKLAREVRDELDEQGIASRASVLRSRRSLRRIDLRDGMKRLIWDYDPESAGVVDEVYDRATSPRRGGPRFVDAEQARRAESLEHDERTTPQIASDAFTELLRQAAGLDTTVLLGAGAPAVRVLVAAEHLLSNTGHGTIEGSNEAVSIATVQALVCTNGTRMALIDSVGDVLDLGRTQRLFSSRQRQALAIRDGGCMWPGCPSPPSWCEAHHIDEWHRGGRTDLDSGILLCRHHHLRLHNEGWRIVRRASRHWLEAPARSGRPGALLETKSRAMREHLARTRAAESKPLPLIPVPA